MRRAASLLPACLALASCAGLADPIERPGTWQPRGVNDANLRAMIVDPAHLERGVGDPRGRARQASGAIERLEDDEVKPLPDVRASPRIGPGGGGGVGQR